MIECIIHNLIKFEYNTPYSHILVPMSHDSLFFLGLGPFTKIIIYLSRKLYFPLKCQFVVQLI